MKLLERGAAVDLAALDGSMAVALHYAARNGLFDIVEALIKFGAGVNKETRRYETPLHLACLQGCAKCVHLLLCAGAHVSVKECQGCTPLHLAVTEPGRMGVVDLLLSSGADVNTKDNGDRIPLMLAAHSGCGKTVKLLLEAGSDPNSLDTIKRGALYYAQSVEVVKLLIAKGASVDVVDQWDFTLLQSAGYNGLDTGVICALYQAGADPIFAADVARQKEHEDAALLLDMLEAKYSQTKGSEERNIGTIDLPPGTEPVNKILTAAGLLDIFASQCIEVRDSYERKPVDDSGTKEDPPTQAIKVFGWADLCCIIKPREENEEEAGVEPQAKKQSTAPCLNCDAVTNRRCSGCGDTSLCSKECEMAARHVCCE